MRADAKNLLDRLIALPVALLAALMIGMPLDKGQQWTFAIIAIVGSLALDRWKGRKGALMIGILSVLVSSRYMFWRTTQTLSFGTLPEFFFGSGLYLVELYAWISLFLGFAQTAWPLERQRLHHAHALMHFQSALPRIVFLTSPLAYLIFGQNIIQASPSLIFAYAAPHIFVYMLWSERVQDGPRRPSWRETLLAFLRLVSAPAMALFQPRKGAMVQMLALLKGAEKQLFSLR